MGHDDEHISAAFISFLSRMIILISIAIDGPALFYIQSFYVRVRGQSFSIFKLRLGSTAPFFSRFQSNNTVSFLSISLIIMHDNSLGDKFQLITSVKQSP